MKSKLFKFELLGFVFCCILGTLSHFFYDWSEQNIIVGMFCPVNESVWEHLKLIYTPYFLWAIAEYFILGEKKINLFFSKFTGAISGMLTILFFNKVVLF